MSVSPLKQDRKGQPCPCAHDPQLFPWQVTETAATWNGSQAVFQANSDISPGRAEFCKDNSPCCFETSSKWRHTPPATPLLSPSTTPFPIMSHVFAFSSPAHATCYPPALSSPPLLMETLHPGPAFMLVSTSSSSRNQMSKIKVYAILCQGQVSFLIGMKDTWLYFLKKIFLI